MLDKRLKKTVESLVYVVFLFTQYCEILIEFLYGRLKQALK